MNDKDTIRQWWIYRITSPSGRVYIGKTRDLRSRIRQYGKSSILNHKKQQPLIYRSIEKYGFESHTVDVVDSFYSLGDFAAAKEIFWIRSYMSNKNKFPEQNGMNLTDGGDGGLLGYTRSEETIRKMSEAAKGRPVSEYQKSVASVRHKGNKYRLGKKLSQEHKDKIRDGNRGKKMTDQQRAEQHKRNIELRGKPILQFDLSGVLINEFSTMKDAANSLGITTDTLRFIITGKTKRPNHANRNFTLKYK